MGPADDQAPPDDERGPSADAQTQSDDPVSSADGQARSDDDRVSAANDRAPSADDRHPSLDGHAPTDRRPTAGAGRRSVEVPPELFRIVVVFSTLIAVASVILGFAALDAATRVVENPTGSPVVGLVRAATGLSAAGVEPYLTPIALAVGVLGLALVGGGVWVYAVGTRFRTSGMETPNTDGDEADDDG